MRLQLERLPDDWMADWLSEREVVRLNPDGSNSVHRVQVIQCRHGDNEYYETNDLGDAERYVNEPLFVMAAGVTKVGRVRHIADEQRQAKPLAERRGLGGPEDMLGLFLQAEEERDKVARHVSVVGPGLVKTR